MIVYKVDPKRSNIHLSSKVGIHRIEGKMKTEGGKLISELGELIEGNVRFDLSSLSIHDSSLDPKEKEKLDKLLKSSAFLNGEDTIADYSIETVISQKKGKKIKGLLRLGNYAYGVNMDVDIDQINHDIHAKGKIQISKSNFEFLEDIDKAMRTESEIDRSINTLEIDCDLYATDSKKLI